MWLTPLTFFFVTDKVKSFIKKAILFKLKILYIIAALVSYILKRKLWSIYIMVITKNQPTYQTNKQTKNPYEKN